MSDNYVATVHAKCGKCGDTEPIPFDMGAPIEDLVPPVTKTVEFVCPNCGPQGPASYTLSATPP